VLAVVQLSSGMVSGPVNEQNTFYHSGASVSAVITGATVVMLSFTASTAITMYAEGGAQDVSRSRRRHHLTAYAVVVSLRPR